MEKNTEERGEQQSGESRRWLRRRVSVSLKGESKRSLKGDGEKRAEEVTAVFEEEDGNHLDKARSWRGTRWCDGKRSLGLGI